MVAVTGLMGGCGTRVVGRHSETPGVSPPSTAARLTATKPAECSISATLVPGCGAWFGVAPGAWTTTPEDVALNDFEAATGRTAAIVHSYHRGGRLFPTPAEIAIENDPNHDRILFFNWKPEEQHTWAEVASGAVDDEIDREAGFLRTHMTHRFFITIHHEPENDVHPAPGSGYTAEDYRAMFRHVVLRLRARGVTRAVTVMSYIGLPKWGHQTWFDQLYPGDDVVDWVGEDQYSRAEPGVYHGGFGEMVGRTAPEEPGWPGFYEWAQHEHPNKPLMLSEWGLFYSRQNPAYGRTFFADVVASLQQFPRIKALVYFDSPSIPPYGESTAVSQDRPTLASYRRLGALSYLNPAVPSS